MSWVTILWSGFAAVCLTLAALHLLVWCRRRSAWDHAFFVLVAVSVAALLVNELQMMRAGTATEYIVAVRWRHIPVAVLILSLVGFVRLHLRAGRPWLAWAVCGTRVIALILNFVATANLNFREITAVRPVSFLGDTVVVAEGMSSPWMLVGLANLLLFLIFASDATLTVWRRGKRRQSLLLGGGIVFFTVAGTVDVVLVNWGVLPAPVTVGMFFLGIVVAVSFELSDGVIQSARLSDDLRASEVRYRGIFDGAIEGIYRTSLQGKSLVVNPAMARMLGYDSAESFVRSVVDTARQVWVDPKERSRFVRLLTEQTTVQGYECRFKSRDGTHIWVSLSSRVVCGPDGQPAYYEGFVADITERKRIEEAVAESEQRYRTLFEAAPVGIIKIGLDGCVTSANPEQARLYGYDSAEELIGRPAILFVAERDRERATENMRAQLQGSEVVSRVYVSVRRDESEFISEVTGGILRGEDPQHKVQGYLCITRDITERQEAEARLHAAYEEIKSLKDRIEAENVYLRSEIRTIAGYEKIVGQSEAIRRVLAQAEQVAPTDSNVLIQGQTGTGKELLAHVIHLRSHRKENPFVTVNLASLPSSLLESELFGREKGAYTGALTRQTGRFEVADGGTVFLDEIGEMPMETQAKLLRVLQQGEFERLGSTRTLKVNVRIVAATNRNLEAAVRNGHFREDLYYRLNVFPIRMPPLSERREDIPLLVWSFIKEFGEKMGKRIEKVCHQDMEALQAYSWPGNVRELRNVIERSMIVSRGVNLQLDLSEVLPLSAEQPLDLAEADKRHILDVLAKTKWRIRGEAGAADLLGLKPSTLESKMKKLGITRPQ